MCHPVINFLSVGNLKQELNPYFKQDHKPKLFHCSATQEEISDSWLDGVDWGKVKEVNQETREKREREDEAEEEAAAAYDETDCIRQMVALMRPKENVAKALRRLGGGKKTSAQGSNLIDTFDFWA